jgi:SAM-dependent methyltransferase
MSSVRIPMPPLELRQIVGPTDPEDFDNPRGEPIYDGFGVPVDAYEAVFDFGCGCGREARRLLQQNPRPRRYVGVDAHKTLIHWCQRNLSPISPDFQFLHHDVYSPLYSTENKLQLTEPFPVGDREFSLIVAISIFTHLCLQQTEYYLAEITRILKPRGVALTTWFFFDRASFLS